MTNIQRAVLMVVSIGASGGILQAQTSRVRVSPHETHTFTVDGANMTVTYGRPSTRGRKIFGALVPYNVVWMPGADEATVFETTKPLRLGDFTLPAGAYSLYTMP